MIVLLSFYVFERINPYCGFGLYVHKKVDACISIHLIIYIRALQRYSATVSFLT